MIELICYVFAFVFFVVAVFGIPQIARWNLVAAGLAFWILGEHIIGAVAR